MRRKSDRFLWFCHEAFVAPALPVRHKAPQIGVWLKFCFTIRGWHTEETRVVVTRATCTTKNSMGRQLFKARKTSTGFLGSLLVYFLVTCFSEYHATSVSSDHRHVKAPGHHGGAVPRCHSTPCHTERSLNCSGHCVPSASSFQGCDLSPVLQVLHAPRSAPQPVHPCGYMRWP